MAYTTLLTEQKEGVFFITVNRESKLNALNKDVLSELRKALEEAYQSKSIRAVIITGSGNKAFVAGADISEFSSLDVDAAYRLAAYNQENIFNYIENFNKPVIAAINGYALGGGLELAMACHIRVASPGAKMGLPEVTLGIIPGYGGTQRLTQLVGKGKAIEMIATADMISSYDALQIGLVNYVVNDDELLPKCTEIAQKIAQRAPLAVAYAINAVNASLNTSVNGFETEIQNFANCFNSSDVKEGVAAFLEKRKPVFKGE